MLTLDAFCRTLNLEPCWFMGHAVNSGDCGELDARLRKTIVELYRQLHAIVETKAADGGLTLRDEPITLTTEAPYLRVKPGVKFMKLTRYTVTASVPAVASICEDTLTLTATVPALDTCETLRAARVVWPDEDYRLGVELIGRPTIVGTTLTIKARAHNFIDFNSTGLISTVTVEYDVERPSVPVAVYRELPCAPLAAPTDDCDSTEIAEPTRKPALTYTDSHVVKFVPTEYCAQHLTGFEADAINVGVWDASFVGAFVSVINTFLPANYCACSPIANERWKYDNGLTEDPTKTILLGGYTPFGTMKPGAHTAWKIFSEKITAPIIF